MLWYILKGEAAPWSLTGTRPTLPTSLGTGCAPGRRRRPSPTPSAWSSRSAPKGGGALGGPGGHGRGPGPLPGLHPEAGQGTGHHRPGRHPRGEKAVPEKGEVDEEKAQGAKLGGDPQVQKRGRGGPLLGGARAGRASPRGHGPAPEGLLPPSRPRTRAISLRLDEDLLRRLKAVARRKGKGYQTLLKEFVLERLYEEEKREGVI